MTTALNREIPLKKSRVALVAMPWTTPDIPPLGIAVLKSYLAERGVEADCFYFNVRFFKWAGALTDTLSVAPYGLLAEWLFSYHLFGPGGLREQKEQLQDVCSSPAFRDCAAGLPFARLEKLLHEDIPDFLDHCLDGVDWKRYRLIGFSSMFHNHAASLALSKRIKDKHPNIPIAFGGANVEGEMGRATMKACEWIDYVIDGEGEEAFSRLVFNLGTGRSHEGIPRLAFRSQAGIRTCAAPARDPIDMEQVPPPDHDDYFKEIKNSGLADVVIPRATFEASRGCWWGQKQHCTFCGLNGQAMAYRAKSAQKVADEILMLHRRHKVHKLFACDNILGMEHLRELIPILKKMREEKGLDWQIFFEIKSNLKPEHIKALGEAGIGVVQPGIESLSTPVLRLMRKGVTAIQNIQTLKTGTGRINLVWVLIWGFPGEDPEEYARMRQTILSLTHLFPASYAHHIRIDRFSPYYFDWKKFGIAKPEPAPAHKFIYPSSRFDLDEIAYFFETKRRPGTPSPAVYAQAQIAPLVKFWQEIYNKNYFAFRKGDGFMDLYDSRPLASGQVPRHRQHSIEGLDAAIFESCGEISRLGDIMSFCRKEHPGCGEKGVRRRLDAMAARRWIFEENGAYLALALPVGALPAAQKLALDRMVTATHVRHMPRLQHKNDVEFAKAP